MLRRCSGFERNHDPAVPGFFDMIRRLNGQIVLARARNRDGLGARTLSNKRGFDGLRAAQRQWFAVLVRVGVTDDGDVRLASHPGR